MTLRPVQVAALAELYDHGGVLLQAGVGQGKTLISALAGTVLAAARPLLVVPANLREKTAREFRELAKHWRIAPVRIVSYEELGRAGGMALLERYSPDLLVLDEAHRAKNPRAGVTRKVRRYVREQRATVRVLVMSGTLCKRSILDFAHLARWARDRATPLPEHQGELVLWSSAVDEKVAKIMRVEPGALSLFGGTGDDELEAARTGLRDRIFSTPGFIATTRNDVPDCSLIVEAHEISLSAEVQDAFEALKSWTTPCGLDIENGLELWRHCRELATDFYYRWRVPPPPEWLAARRAWCKAVRAVLATNRRELDTEDQVRREVVAAGERHILWPVWREWQEVRPTFELETVPVWCGTHCLDFVREWAARHVGLIWVEWPIVGQRIAREVGLEYYGREGLNAHGRPIEDEKGDRCAVASIAANGTGRNLQFWSRALVTSAPPTGTAAEQMIGRIHRPGQMADEVTYDFMIACREQMNGFAQSLRDAGFHNALLGSEMKLLAGSRTADILVPQFDRIGPAWREPDR
jgi:hypothetical protein